MAGALGREMSANGLPPQSARQEQNDVAEAATRKASGFAGMLQSARNSINRNMEPFSEGLHKVVGGSTEKDSGYDSDSEASVTEVRADRTAASLNAMGVRRVVYDAA